MISIAVAIYALGAVLAFPVALAVQGRPVTRHSVWVAFWVAILWPVAVPLWVLLIALGL